MVLEIRRYDFPFCPFPSFRYLWRMEERGAAQRRMVLIMATLTLVLMPVTGWVISLFSSKIILWDRWVGNETLSYQIGIGLAVGTIAGFLARKVIEMDFMEPVRSRYAARFADLKLNWVAVVYISLCAGIGEELLFRGAIQPLLGIVITAIVFVAIHGYLNPKDWRVSVYGIFMTIIIVLFGWMTDEIGIWSAVIAHAMVDVILLADLGKEEA